MRIAYVEDNPTNLALVERVAGMNQHVIVSYTEGEIALQELKREIFDLILMDVELAGDMGGLDVVRKLRAHGLQTPIVAVTAYAMMGDRDKCMEAGCTDYLSKPMPIPQLIALLNRYDEITKQGGVAVPTTAPAIALPPEPVQSTPTAPVETPKQVVPTPEMTIAKTEVRDAVAPVETSIAKSEPSPSAAMPEESKTPKPTQ